MFTTKFLDIPPLAGAAGALVLPGSKSISNRVLLLSAWGVGASLAVEQPESPYVDLRTVKPLDTDTILASVARTGRLLAVGESWPWGGVSAEVVSRVASEGFELLDAPPRRLNAKDTPIPYHPNLWSAHRPTAVRIAEALREVLRY
jgi:pyruvate dehydrogenase E1 component beta subunit/2-oxoisovalerate dehydrogenase E1 component beta subunit